MQLERSLRTHIAAPHPLEFLVLWAWDGAGVICMSDKFPCHSAVAPGVEITFWQLLLIQGGEYRKHKGMLWFLGEEDEKKMNHRGHSSSDPQSQDDTSDMDSRKERHILGFQIWLISGSKWGREKNESLSNDYQMNSVAICGPREQCLFFCNHRRLKIWWKLRILLLDRGTCAHSLVHIF